MIYKLLTVIPGLKKYALRLVKGDEIIQKLISFAIKEKVTFAEISGIGAIKNIEVGIYENGDYVKFNYPSLHELLSLNGNITIVDKQPYPHLHPVFSIIGRDDDIKVCGGHLFEATVGVTAEIFINVYDVKIGRALDSKCGLKVWAL